MKFIHILLCSLILAIFLLGNPALIVSASESPSQEETSGRLSSADLPIPQNIPASEKCPAITYRLVNETVYASGPLYIRSGPGSDQPIIGKIQKGDAIDRGAVGNNGWSQVLYQDQEAYANTTYLSVTPIPGDGESEENIYRQANDFVRALCVTKLRTGPGPQYAVIGHLTQGSGAHRIAAGRNGWSKLLFHDTEAYACTADLKTGNAQDWQAAEQSLYTACGTALLAGPGHGYKVLRYLSQGEELLLTAISTDGWCKVTCNGLEGYMAAAFLSDSPDSRIPAVETSQAEIPTPNAPFIYQYMAPEGIMPHAFFTPKEADLSKPLPLIISLHGALEIGEAPNTLKHNFITKAFLNWEYTGLQGFDAYIVCPQLTGCGYASTWRSPETADMLFALIDYLKESHPIDESKIVIEGHSLGGEGVIYMAADPRACFSAVVPVSAYNPYVDITSIQAPMRGYTGSPFLPAPREDWDSYHYMQNIFRNHFGIQNLFVKNCSHYDIPTVAMEEDLNNDGKSDLIEWMLSQ